MVVTTKIIMNKIKCEICNNNFTNYQILSIHIRKIHNISSKEYYDKYYKMKNEGLCVVCSNETKFMNTNRGYTTTCSQSCRNSNRIVSEETRKKMSKIHKGKVLTAEHKAKISESLLHNCRKLTVEHKAKIAVSNSNRIVSELTKMKISTAAIGRKHTEKTKKKMSLKRKGRKFTEDHKRKISLANKGKKMTYEVKRNMFKDIPIEGFAGYISFNKRINWVEETRRDSENLRILNVKCTNCRQWFRPTPGQVRLRIKGILTYNYHRFYCSETCKNTCSIYKKHQYQSDHPKHDFERPFQNEWKEAIKIRANGKCEICGSDGKICHHINPVKTHPHEVADIDNGILLCEICNKRVHSDRECTTGHLASLICS